MREPVDTEMFSSKDFFNFFEIFMDVVFSVSVFVFQYLPDKSPEIQ